MARRSYIVTFALRSDYPRRLPQARKHKTWEGDGVLVVNSSRATLMDQDGRVYALSFPVRLCAHNIPASVPGRLACKSWKRARR